MKKTAVLDTNVLLAMAVRWEEGTGTLAELSAAWRTGRFIHYSSHPIHDETTRHLDDRYYARRVSEATRHSLLTRLQADIRDTGPVRAGIAAHPEDDQVIAVALSTSADYFVTGDRELLRRDGIEGLRIVSPRAFLDILTVE